MSQAGKDNLPKAPQVPRRIGFARTQAIGMPLIALLPILAVCGVFDSNVASTETSSGGISLLVHYPARFRYETREPLLIRVSNSGSAVHNLTVRLNRSYLDHFEKVQFRPDPDEIDAEGVAFQIDGLKPGESRSVEVEFEMNRMGRVQGLAEVEADGSPGPVAEFYTLVFP